MHAQGCHLLVQGRTVLPGAGVNHDWTRRISRCVNNRLRRHSLEVSRAAASSPHPIDALLATVRNRLSRSRVERPCTRCALCTPVCSTSDNAARVNEISRYQMIGEAFNHVRLLYVVSGLASLQKDFLPSDITSVQKMFPMWRWPISL